MLFAPEFHPAVGAMDMITLFDTVCTLVLIALLGMTIIVLWLGQFLWLGQ